MRTWRLRQLGELAAVVPAPMSGYGDRAWRELARSMGCDLVHVPMISAEGLARDDAKTRALIDVEGEAPPVAVQLFGTRPEALAEASRKVEALGVAAVDLNLGCPARRVVRHEGGVALLKHPDLVRDILAAMRQAVALPLTVKTRTGWERPDPDTLEIARIVEGEGADALALHARTGRQQFTGRADWRWIAAAREAVAIPVIGNGDIESGEDAWRMQRETGCDAVMIGRAAVGRPWLWREALAWLAAEGPPPGPPASPGRDERLDTLIEHARLMAGHRGEPRGIVEFRKHAVRYVRGMRGGKSLKQTLVTCSTLDEVQQAVRAFRDTVEDRVG
jgi:nifR3 family TIM-barrel protein